GTGTGTGTDSFGVRPFPGALRLVRVRPPYRDDPLRLRFGRYPRTDGAEDTQRGLVAECEALDGPVPGARILIGAGSEDLPHVLGALSAAAPSPTSPPSPPPPTSPTSPPSPPAASSAGSAGSAGSASSAGSVPDQGGRNGQMPFLGNP